MITFEIEPGGAIIQVVSKGEATLADIDLHYDELRRAIVAVRAANRPVRVLSDQTQAKRLSEHLSRYIKLQMERTYESGDRVALLMAGPDDQVYARNILGLANFAVFHSRLAAEIWLMEPALKLPASQI